MPRLFQPPTHYPHPRQRRTSHPHSPPTPPRSAARSFPPAVDDVDSWEAAYGFDSYDLLVPRLPLDPRGADFIDGNFNATPFVNEAPPGTPYNVMSGTLPASNYQSHPLQG